MSSDPYLLGMAPAEIERLKRQHDTWRRLTSRAWDLAGFGPGQTIVDLGSGPGFTSIELAARVGPSGRVIAVDSSSAATAYLGAEVVEKGIGNVQVVTADLETMDLSAWRPDALFARWVFSFLRQPRMVLQRIAAACSAGGVIAVMDYWNYQAIRAEPASELFRTVFRAVYESFADAGGSLDVAGGLPELFDETGFRVTVIEPFCQVGRPGSPVWEWIAEFQSLYLPTLVDKGYLSAETLQDYQGWWRRQSRNPNAIVFAPPILCVVGVKS